MEENRSSCPVDVCDKIYKAIRCITLRPQNPVAGNPAPNPAVKNHDIHIIPISSDHPKPSSEAGLLRETPKKGEVAEEIPVNFDYSSLPAPPNGNNNIQKNGQVPKVAPKMEPVSHTAPVNEPEKAKADMAQPGKVAKVASKIDKQEGKQTGMHIEDKFTDYIKRAKIKIRTTSNAGDAKRTTDSGVVDHKGKNIFQDYIDRAKIKLSTTSSNGGARSDSFK
ncbi:hypothetical protein CFOL_v3_22180 [Cephalotus follicularis]|uniref:Uncharacterized protein n=1 Tax=Cephalotus follicularis TaxID=3775 RepID=A0A1Q3CET6_CEPFO|nr:hypothetical protein CFOL_v3_22180 [Cephalotus follicularis]